MVIKCDCIVTMIFIFNKPCYLKFFLAHTLAPLCSHFDSVPDESCMQNNSVC